MTNFNAFFSFVSFLRRFFLIIIIFVNNFVHHLITFFTVSIVKLVAQSVSSKDVETDSRPQTPTDPDSPWNKEVDEGGVESRWNSRKVLIN